MTAALNTHTITMDSSTFAHPGMQLPGTFDGASIFGMRPPLPVPQPRLPGRAKRRRGPPEKNTGPTPSLPSLQNINKRKSKTHYKGRKAARNAADAPPAPANSNSFLLGTGLTPVVDSGAADGLQLKFHSRTPNPLKPGTSWKNAPLGPDAEYLLGAIDMYGSNAGLISRKDEKEAGESLSDDSDSDPDDMLEFALHQPDVDIPDEQPPHQARLRLEEQAAYIAELEEQNMTLREKLFLLQEELKEALSHDRSRSATPDYDG